MWIHLKPQPSSSKPTSKPSCFTSCGWAVWYRNLKQEQAHTREREQNCRSLQDGPWWSLPPGIYDFVYFPPTLYHAQFTCVTIKYSWSDGKTFPILLQKTPAPISVTHSVLGNLGKPVVLLIRPIGWGTEVSWYSHIRELGSGSLPSPVKLSDDWSFVLHLDCNFMKGLWTISI